MSIIVGYTFTFHTNKNKVLFFASFNFQDTLKTSDIAKRFQCAVNVIEKVVTEENNSTLSNEWAPRKISLQAAIKQLENCTDT